MAKKKSTLGKLFAFATTIAAIGGTCYIFRDKIKQSSIYKTALDKLSILTGKDDNDFEDDFFSEDSADDFEDVFEDTDPNREYTSITINAKESDSTEEQNLTDSAVEDSIAKEAHTSEPNNAETAAKTTSDKDTSDKSAITGRFDESIPTINLNAFSASKPENASGYENENLSDSSDDPDVLAEQDKLDF